MQDYTNIIFSVFITILQEADRTSIPPTLQMERLRLENLNDMAEVSEKTSQEPC